MEPGKPISLKAWRLYRLMTQEELATATGLSVRTVSHLETAGRPPRLSTLKALAKALGTEARHLYRLPTEED